MSRILSDAIRLQHYEICQQIYNIPNDHVRVFKHGSVECIVTTDTVTKEALIDFRGSQGFLDWVVNARWFSTKLRSGSLYYEAVEERKLSFRGAITFGSTRPFVGSAEKVRTQRVLQRHVEKVLIKVLKSNIIPRGYTVSIGGHSKGGKEAAIAVALLFKYPACKIVEYCINRKDLVTHTPSHRWHFGKGYLNIKSFDLPDSNEHTLSAYESWVK